MLKIFKKNHQQKLNYFPYGAAQSCLSHQNQKKTLIARSQKDKLRHIAKVLGGTENGRRRGHT